MFRLDTKCYRQATNNNNQREWFLGCLFNCVCMAKQCLNCMYLKKSIPFFCCQHLFLFISNVYKVVANITIQVRGTLKPDQQPDTALYGHRYEKGVLTGPFNSKGVLFGSLCNRNTICSRVLHRTYNE